MGSNGSAATGVPGQACVLQYRAVVPAPSVLCVVQRGAGVSCGGDQGHAVFERDMSCGVRGHTDNFVSDPAASDVYVLLADCRRLLRRCAGTNWSA